ncbi:hypothetical protein Hanom_Chr08g00757151 [Helianthus anomalus]
MLTNHKYKSKLQVLSFKFAPFCRRCPLAQKFTGGVLNLSKSCKLCYHWFRGEIESSDSECESIVPHLNPVSSPINELRMLRLNGSFPSFSPTGDLIAFNPDFDSKAGLDIVKSDSSRRWNLLKG